MASKTTTSFKEKVTIEVESEDSDETLLNKIKAQNSKFTANKRSREQFEDDVEKINHLYLDEVDCHVNRAKEAFINHILPIAQSLYAESQTASGEITDKLEAYPLGTRAYLLSDFDAYYDVRNAISLKQACLTLIAQIEADIDLGEHPSNNTEINAML
jgi:hypothetical protein